MKTKKFHFSKNLNLIYYFENYFTYIFKTIIEFGELLMSEGTQRSQEHSIKVTAADFMPNTGALHTVQ